MKVGLVLLKKVYCGKGCGGIEFVLYGNFDGLNIIFKCEFFNIVEFSDFGLGGFIECIKRNVFD